MSNSEQRLTARQLRAVEALLSNNVTDAAKVIGVSRRTLTNWLALPHFQAALHDAEAQLVSASIRRMASATDTAVDTLIDAMKGADKDSVKVRAADVILGRLFDLKQLADIEQRLRALEEQQHAKP